MTLRGAGGFLWACRNQEADAYAELSRRGWTQQRIADECGVNQSTVSRFIHCANYALGHNRPSFWTAYQEAKAGPAKAVAARRGRGLVALRAVRPSPSFGVFGAAGVSDHFVSLSARGFYRRHVYVNRLDRRPFDLFTG